MSRIKIGKIAFHVFSPFRESLAYCREPKKHFLMERERKLEWEDILLSLNYVRDEKYSWPKRKQTQWLGVV